MKYLFSIKNPCILLIGIVNLFIISCTDQVKKDTNNAIINRQNIVVNWAAFKTTDKIRVEGVFRDIELSNLKKGKTITKVLNNIEFKIPISSLFSNNELRDTKIKKMFFGAMLNTISLKGTLHLNNNNTGYVNLLMNGIKKKFPINYNINQQDIQITGTLNLETWKTQTALASFNKACFDLHKGPDGVSKTWDEVEVKAIIPFN